VQHQLVKKGRIWPSPNTGHELYLAAKLEAVGRSSNEVLARVKNLPVEEGFAELRRLVQGWSGASDNLIIDRILANAEKEQTTNYQAYRKRTGLYYRK
jgi:hypothetical protein